VTKLVGLGAGGHARVVIDILRLQPEWSEILLLDKDPDLVGTEIDGAKVIGDDDALPQLVRDGVRSAFVGLGSSPDTGPHARLYRLALDAGLEVVTATHRSATVSGAATVGRGATICANAVVGPGTVLGDDVIVNTSAVIEHDCTVGDHVHVASGAVVGGGVTIGSGSFVGLGARVLPSVRVGHGVVVAAGAVVVRDVDDGLVVAGVPADVLRRDS
jgi:UDP-perosamine 4-acetyltransferase